MNGVCLMIKRCSWPLLAVACLFIAAHAVQAQDKEYLERIRPPAAVRGGVGGESHNSYVVRARKGQVMTVQISWRHKHDAELGDNHAEFYVSVLPIFSGDGEVKFGKESNGGKRWRGKIPKTGDYYIYVMGYPIADYTLKVTLS
jgi:hypothetical protein